MRMHVWAMMYELCNFRDVEYDSNALKIAFKTNIAQYK